MAESSDKNDLIAFSAEFARIVTAPTNDDANWVARNGKESIFGVLKEMFPQVYHDNPCRYTILHRLTTECSSLRSVNMRNAEASRDSPSWLSTRSSSPIADSAVPEQDAKASQGSISVLDCWETLLQIVDYQKGIKTWDTNLNVTLKAQM